MEEIMKKPLTKNEQQIYDMLVNEADKDGFINLTYKSIQEITDSLPITIQLIYRRINSIKNKDYIEWEKKYYIRLKE
jgi:DNA invertase Pin-like site-specific DNA recombinase